MEESGEFDQPEIEEWEQDLYSLDERGETFFNFVRRPE